MTSVITLQDQAKAYRGELVMGEFEAVVSRVGEQDDLLPLREEKIINSAL